MDDPPRTLYLVLLLLLVGSSLIGMRLPIGKVLKMAAAWVAIFGVVFILFAFRDDFSSLGQRLRAELTGRPIDSGEELRIPIASDGHFWVSARVNGREVRFMVDSGASVTTMGEAAAGAAGIERTGRTMTVSTANGTVQMARGRAARFQLGPIVRTDLAVNVNPGDDLNVVGMNFLSSLGSWRVEGNYLVLRP